MEEQAIVLFNVINSKRRNTRMS